MKWPRVDGGAPSVLKNGQLSWEMSSVSHQEHTVCPSRVVRNHSLAKFGNVFTGGANFGFWDPALRCVVHVEV